MLDLRSRADAGMGDLRAPGPGGGMLAPLRGSKNWVMFPVSSTRAVKVPRDGTSRQGAPERGAYTGAPPGEATGYRGAKRSANAWSSWEVSGRPISFSLVCRTGLNGEPPELADNSDSNCLSSSTLRARPSSFSLAARITPNGLVPELNSGWSMTSPVGGGAAIVGNVGTNREVEPGDVLTIRGAPKAKGWPASGPPVV